MILQAIALLFIISLIGSVLLKVIINEKRLSLLIPAGMTLGVCIYIFLLNLTSKLLPGGNGIILATILLLLLGLGSFVMNRNDFKFKINLKSLNYPALIITLGLILLTFYFARLKMTAVFPSADSDMQWAYAASFARGNSPIKASWQPSFNPNYHLGAYFLEGAILSLTKLPLITIHTILNTYYLVAGALFSLLFFWEYKYSFKNLWLILAAIIFYISFGVIILIFPTQHFLENINLNSYLSSATSLPTNIIAKGTGGASLVDLNSLSFLPARSLSLGLAFLALYLFFTPFKGYQLKIIILSTVFSTTALIEESIFLPMFLTLISIFILSLLSPPKLNYLKSERNILFHIIIVTALVVILQGGFISELINQKESTFNIYLPYSQAFKDRLPILLTSIQPSASAQFNLILPGPLVMALLTLIYSYFRDRRLSIIALFSLISLFCYLSIESKFYPSNNIRFYNLAYITAGAGFVYSISIFMRNKSILQNLLIFLLFCFFIAPSFVPEILNQSKEIGKAGINNVRSQILVSSEPSRPFDEIANWAKINLPKNSQLISIDTEQPSPKRSVQFEFKGLYTTLSPQDIRVGRPEPGAEFFDLSLTLNPSIFKKTRTDYIYIESDSKIYQQLPQLRKDDLSNNKYFKLLKSIDTKLDQNKDIFYRIYKVLPDFLDSVKGGKEVTEGTLESLERLIPNNSSVYVSDYGEPPQLSFWYRMATILALKDKDIRRNLSQTDYMLVETSIPYKMGSIDGDYDFYILAPNNKPPFPSEIIWSNIYANCWKRVI